VISRRTPRFKKAFSELPQEIKDAARESYRRFRDDPSHPSLHLKQVHPSEPIYSVRISLQYRALAVKEGNTYVWFWIGSHSQYDALLKRLS
jgi:hypothetical protein